MKKLLYLLFLLPMALFFSCSSDSDYPNVDITVTMDNVTEVDGLLYAVQTDTVAVESVTVKSNTGETATLSSVEYIIDYRNVGVSIVSPFSYLFPMQYLARGTHLFQIYMGVLQVDKSMASALVSNQLRVVPSEADLPVSAPPLGKVSVTYTVSPR